nr:MAG TPA: hypothetical protein [Caudoviricetes sp.]
MLTKEDCVLPFVVLLVAHHALLKIAKASPT